MSSHDVRSAQRPDPDALLVEIARYASEQFIDSELAYATARHCLMDSIACSLMALAYPACRRVLGPVVPGATLAGGVRIPGCSWELEPVQAAFNIGAMVRWLDFNDTWLAAEWGHPSDNLGAILAVADWRSRGGRGTGTPPSLRDVFTAMIKAHEIQGVLALENSFNRVGLDHVLLVRVASTAVATAMLGGTRSQVIDAVSNAWIDGGALRTYRHAPNTGSRKSWAAGDATARAVRLALLTLAGEMGYPSALSAPRWGFQDVLFKEQPLRLARPLGSYVMENVLFKISYPAEFHAQTAVECALRLHPQVRDRLHDVAEVLIETQEPGVRIIDKTGPLSNPADRDHCIQYMSAIPLIFGRLTAADYEDGVAGDPRVDALRARMKVVENPAFTRDYYAADKRFIGNAMQVRFRDGSSTERVHVDYPIGHRLRRAEGIPLLEAKFEAAVKAHYPAAQAGSLLALFADVRAIKKLQRAYGYYADRGLWNDLADLFTDDATANYPSGGFDGNASIRAMFVQNLGQGREGLAEGRIYNHTILQPVVDLSADGATATGRWRVLGMLGRFGGSAIWADSLYRFDYVKQNGRWKIHALTAYAGSGGGYADGWVAPKPRPPGPDTSPVRFNLAHPADRPWIDPCEADVSACVVPFPYPNRGGLKPPMRVSAQIVGKASAAELVRRAQRLDDEAAVMNLQNAYGYYLDRGEWQSLVALFAPDGTREVGQGGVYVGRERVRASMELSGPQGLREGQINDHFQFEPIITVAPDGNSAQGRIFELGFVGGGGVPGRIIQNIQENTYVKRGGSWMIQSAHHYTILLTDYAQGWAKSAFPPRAISSTLPPDRPPSVAYEAYPKVFTPPLHFGNPSTTSTGSSGAEQDAAATPGPDIVSAVSQALRAADYDEIENLQNALGYYAEKSLWTDMAALFSKDGSLVLDEQRHAGRQRILSFLKTAGPEGPVKGSLDSQLQLQPVIHIAADGRRAQVRSRLLQLSRDAQGRPLWGGGIYESEVVKEAGVWMFRRLHFYRSFLVDYRTGWTQPVTGEGQRLPSRFTPPFHYQVKPEGGLRP